MPSLVLASSSLYRRKLLARLGLPFEVDSPAVDESRPCAEPAEQSVRRLAEAKARACAPRHHDALIIGSDQLCTLDGVVHGKPGSRERAIAQLAAAAGRAVTFHTGVAVLDAASGCMTSRVVLNTVHFRALTAPEISNYVAREQPYDCAGAFRAEGLGIALFRRIEGDDPNALIGLPLIALVDLLAAAGCHVLDSVPSAQLDRPLSPQPGSK